MRDDPRFAALWSVTLEQRANQERVKAEEKPVLSEYAVARQECIARGAAYRSHYDPEMAVAMSAVESRFMGALAELYAGTTTWAEYHRKRIALVEEFQARRTQIAERRQGQAAIQRQQAMNDLLLLQSLQPRPAPAVNCETRHIGSTAYTSCR